MLLTPVECLRHFGECYIGKPHWHAQLGGEPHVLVSEFQSEARRVVLVGQKPIIKAVERALAPAGTGAQGFPKGERLDA